MARGFSSSMSPVGGQIITTNNHLPQDSTTLPRKDSLMATTPPSSPSHINTSMSPADITSAHREAYTATKVPDSSALDTNHKALSRPFSKTVIGSKPTADELREYLQAGALTNRRRSPVSSLGNSIDEDGEMADLEHVSDILMRMGSRGADIVMRSGTYPFKNDTLPDGSRQMLMEYYDVYMEIRTGTAAFHGTDVSPEVKLGFADAAVETSGHRRFLPEGLEEGILNYGCVEYSSRVKSDSQRPEHARIPVEDFDPLPLPYVEASIVPLIEADMVVRLQDMGAQKVAIIRPILVRDDLPVDPYLFSSTNVGIAAAEALRLYQDDDEQIENKVPLADIERPWFEDPEPYYQQLRQANYRLHENPEQQDIWFQHELALMLALRAPSREQFLYACEHTPENADWGSGIFDGRSDYPTRFGLEAPDIVEICRQIYNKPDLAAEDIWITGLMRSEDDFDDNPDYLQAKLMWWKQKMGIDGLEAILRYHFARIRRLRLPDTDQYFLTDEEEEQINPFPTQAPDRYIPSKERFFDELHERPIDADKVGAVVWKWCDAINENGILPDNLFVEDCKKLEELVNDSHGSLTAYDWSFCWRTAHDALVEYQDFVELYAEPHSIIEGWARPMYLCQPHFSAPSSPRPHAAQEESSGFVTLTPLPVGPPGLQLAAVDLEQNKAALGEILKVTALPSRPGFALPPGLTNSPAQLQQNQTALAQLQADSPLTTTAAKTVQKSQDKLVPAVLLTRGKPLPLNIPEAVAGKGQQSSNSGTHSVFELEANEVQPLDSKLAVVGVSENVSTLSERLTQPSVNENRDALTPANQVALLSFLKRVVAEPHPALVDLSSINEPQERNNSERSESTNDSRLSNNDKAVLMNILCNVASRNSSRRSSFDSVPSYHTVDSGFDEPDFSTLEGLLKFKFGIATHGRSATGVGAVSITVMNFIVDG